MEGDGDGGTLFEPVFGDVQELSYIEKISDHEYRIKPGFVPNMKVPGTFYVNDSLSALVFDELKNAAGEGGVGGFLPAVRQVANVAALPGIVKVSNQ